MGEPSGLTSPFFTPLDGGSQDVSDIGEHVDTLPRKAAVRDDIEALRNKLNVLELALDGLKSARKRRGSCSTCSSKIDLESDAEKQQVNTASEHDEADKKKYKRILFLRSRWDYRKGIWIDKPGLPPRISLERVRDDEHGIVWRVRTRGRKSKLKGVEVEIVNEDLRMLLASALRHYPGHWDEKIVFQSPFYALIHSWKDLRKLASESCADGNGQVARDDLTLLLDLIQRTLRLDDGKSYIDYLDQIEKDKTVPFELLWTIYPPGTEVVAKHLNEWQIFVVLSFESSYAPEVFQGPPVNERSGSEDDSSTAKQYFALRCCFYDFDGETFSRYLQNFRIVWFPNNKKISALPCYPIKYHSKPDELKERLEKRGAKFRTVNIRYNTAKLWQHSGKARQLQDNIDEAIDQDSNIVARPPRRYWETAEQVQRRFYNEMTTLVDYIGPVIVDPRAFRENRSSGFTTHFEEPRFQESGECTCTKCMSNSKLDETFRRKYDNCGMNDSGWPEFDKEQLRLCSPRVLGYSLDSKRWIEMSVDNIDVNDVKRQQEQEDAFKDLILPDDDEEGQPTKFLIRSLVQNHVIAHSPRSKPMGIGPLTDFVEGKGQGLIILLHGASGTGKTLTVECVAKLTGKPLLKISVADIGLKPELVERRLKTFFKLAATWDAILLIDEADILLEFRNHERAGLDKNAMVSVFLKILEYYQGILLLTTNRVRSIDAAVESRLNLAVYYPPMQSKDQRALCTKLLDRLSDKDVDNRDKLNNWAKNAFKSGANAFSGRDIRNLISSALAIARAEKVRLAHRHLELVKDAKLASQKVFTEARGRAKADQGS